MNYLGHVVGYGKILPPSVKVQSIMDCPNLKRMREVRFWAWLDITGNFVHASRRSLYPWLICLRRNVNLCGLQNGKQHLSKLTWILSTEPVLQAPDFNKPFSLAISANNVGVGVVLLQEDHQGMLHPISYYSKKFNIHQKVYLTV